MYDSTIRKTETYSQLPLPEICTWPAIPCLLVHVKDDSQEKNGLIGPLVAAGLETVGSQQYILGLLGLLSTVFFNVIYINKYIHIYIYIYIYYININWCSAIAHPLFRPTGR